MEIVQYIASICAGLAVAIPCVAALVKYVRKAIQEKNWAALVKLVADLMKQAEQKFSEGADRKAWVLAMVIGASDSINYEIDEAVVSQLIDDLCNMAKVVNNPAYDINERVGGSE